MRVALLTTDSREYYRQYEDRQPAYGTAPQGLLDGFSALSEVEVHVISCLRQPVITPANLAPNIHVHSLHVPHLGWMRTGYQGCIRAVRKVLREIRPDIVHGQGTERDCAISAVCSGFPNVLTIHGNMREIAKLQGSRPFSFGWLNAHLERLTIPRSDGVVCITRYTEQAVRALARRTWLLPNAVDASFLEVARAVAEPPIVVVVGLICARKNQNWLLRALDELAAREKLRVVFVGLVPEDDYGHEFHRLIAERKWAEHHGFADRAALREWLSQAALLALPSLEDNCPMAVLEAQAAGVPVVAAKVGGVPDLVDDGVTGLLCDPNEETSIASAVDRVLFDRELAARLATAGRAQARARFHPHVVAEEHVRIYREVLAARD